MKQYLSYFKLRFITSLQYRISALAGISTQFFFGFVFVMIYVSFYETGSKDVAITLPQLVSYLWLNQAFFSMMNLYYKDHSMLEMIKNGNICYELCKPQNLYVKWYTKILSNKLAMVSLRFLPVIIVAFLLPSPYNLSLPYSYLSLIFFIISLIFSFFLVVAIITLFHILTFYTLDDKGLYTILIILTDLLSGGYIPIPLFPKTLQMISNYLPFRYIFDLPYRIYSGNISINSAIPNIFIQVIWTIIIIFVGYILNKKILKKVVIQGG